MIKTSKKNTGFTLVETVVAAVIFTLVIVGFYAGINALSKPADLATNEVTAAFIAKSILDDFRNSVSADDWDSGNLAIQTGTALPVVTIDGRDFQPTYTVSDDPDTDAKKVTITVTWND